MRKRESVENWFYTEKLSLSFPLSLHGFSCFYLQILIECTGYFHMFISDSIYSHAFTAPSDTHDEKLATPHASEVLAAIIIQVKKDIGWDVRSCSQG